MNDIDESKTLLFALELDGRGGARELQEDELKPCSAPRWFHFNAANCTSPEYVAQFADGLDTIGAQSILEREARPRCLQVGDNVQLTLRGVNLNDNSHAEDMVAVRMWVQRSTLLSTRYRRLKTVLEIRQRLLKGIGPKSIPEIVTLLCSRMLERMEPVLGDLDDDTDNIEEQIIESAEPELRKAIADVRKRAILYRRYIAPQREAIGLLHRSGVSWLGNHELRSLQESHDRVTRYVEDLDAIRERAQIVKDELANSLSDRLNRNLYTLSVVTAVFLPLGFLTGLFGINIGGMPGVDNSQAFFIFSGILVVLVAAQIALFKFFKWF